MELKNEIHYTHLFHFFVNIKCKVIKIIKKKQKAIHRKKYTAMHYKHYKQLKIPVYKEKIHWP